MRACSGVKRYNDCPRVAISVPRVLRLGDATDDVILRRLGIANPTPLQRHALFFANMDGNFTYESIRNGLDAIGASHPAFKAAVLDAGVNFRITHIRDVAMLMHGGGTGIFTVDGVNEDKLREMQLFARHDNAFTAEDIAEMRGVLAERDKVGRCALGRFFDRVATSGELDLFFEVASDCRREGKRAISFGKYESLYREGSKVFRYLAAAKMELATRGAKSRPVGLSS